MFYEVFYGFCFIMMTSLRCGFLFETAIDFNGVWRTVPFQLISHYCNVFWPGCLLQFPYIVVSTHFSWFANMTSVHQHASVFVKLRRQKGRIIYTKWTKSMRRKRYNEVWQVIDRRRSSNTNGSVRMVNQDNKIIKKSSSRRCKKSNARTASADKWSEQTCCWSLIRKREMKRNEMKDREITAFIVSVMVRDRHHRFGERHGHLEMSLSHSLVLRLR